MPKPPWRERKESHIRTLREASREVLRVASADKLHNARSILSDLRRNGDATWALFRGGREGTLWYYRTLHELLTRSAPGSMVEELGRVLACVACAWLLWHGSITAGALAAQWSWTRRLFSVSAKVRF